MNDKQFLIWLHERLVYQHKEDPLYDYMYKLRSIINAIPKDQFTSNSLKFYSIDKVND